MSFFSDFTKEVIATGIVFILILILRFVIARLVRRYAKSSAIIEHRTNLLINILAAIALIVIWGVKRDEIFLTLSSIATVVGVAMFAQWSILSNITSGIILFFSFPFKIGDVIKVHDRDFPIEAEIMDINAFHTLLQTKSGEIITYPNNLLLQKGISIIYQPYDEKEFMD